VNEQQLRRLFRSLVLLSAPLPLAILGSACGGSMTEGSEEPGGSSGSGGGGGTAQEGGTSNGGSSAGHGGSSAGSAGTFTVAGSGGTPRECQSTVQGGACMPVTATVPRKCVSNAQAVAGQQLPTDKCAAFCNETFAPCSVSTVTATTVSVLCQPGCAVGRRPAGLAESPLCDSRAAGGYFAETAHLEAASVTAFRILRDELRASGAPKKLVHAAARAARDEIRHARSTGALARRFGGTARRPSIARPALRSIEAMAIENAIEGCVRETFGALLATHQAARARDPVVRATMMRIARDETQHAALSWRVASFLSTKLDRTARQNVAQAKRAAASELLSSLQNEPEVTFAELAGLPSSREALQLATELNRVLWP
jgi:hypothetical protein